MQRKLSGALTDLVFPVLYCVLAVALAAWMLITRYPAWIAHPQLCFGDCKLYHSIAQDGYHYADGAWSNTNFFPLFPYIWRLTGLGEGGISFVNFLCFITGNFLLFRNFPSSPKVKMLTLALGCVVFYMLPFTEGMFYLSSVLMLMGLQEKKPVLIFAALTAMCLLRSVSILFIPIWGSLFILRYVQTKDLRRCLPYLRYALWGALLLFFLFSFYKYRTGQFWAFIKAQKVWGTYLRMPQLYFGAWGDDRHLIFVQYAFMICVFTCCYLALILGQQLWKVKEAIVPGDATMFALLYIAGNGLLPLLLRGGEYSSLNRYILATPFLYFFVREMATYSFSRIAVILLLVVEALFLFICWRMTISTERLVIAGGFFAATLTIPWLLKSRSPWTIAGIVIAAAIGIYLQAIQLVTFVRDVWVG